ncbi:hypothetical protein MPF19_12705 [Polaribacter sp. Z014]|uniref:hypothetical protein n=1 Tax=unclassified Polaribacter TaxID=196858 RepID=UPI00193BC7E0|nr:MULTISPECIES: hypothetical protein [unclassified Polaribacter]MCL7764279.1 hypothetical protein [Polaribacter sp. Z014]QVY65082.1 hypothetical protein JOP69_15220 [Polaribacter sp. Q13]
MSLLEKIKQPLFWINFAKVAIPFFVIVTVVSLLIASSSDLFSGDFAKVSETNFANDKWKNFFGFKVVFSAVYGFYMTNKKMV